MDRILDVLADILQDADSPALLLSSESSLPYLKNRGIADEFITLLLEAFDLLQEFINGLYYHVYLQIVDTTTHSLCFVSGTCGYRSPVFLRSMAFIQKKNYDTNRTDLDIILLRRSEVLSILAILLTNPEDRDTEGLPAFQSNERKLQGLRLGNISGRILLPKSVVKDCHSVSDIAGYTIYDTDGSAIPCNPDGLIEPRIT